MQMLTILKDLPSIEILSRPWVLQKKHALSKNTVSQSKYYKILSTWVTKDCFHVNKSGTRMGRVCDHATQSSVCVHGQETSIKMIMVIFYTVTGKSGDTSNRCDRRNYWRQSRKSVGNFQLRKYSLWADMLGFWF